MYRYRKKPVIIEAFQITKETRQDNTNWPEWLTEAWAKEPEEEGALSSENHPYSDGTDKLIIYTLEGIMYVSWGDYIIQGVHGEIYACKPDIFSLTYEKLEE